MSVRDRFTGPVRPAASPRASASRPATASRPVALVEAGFRALARLRRAPALHPQGLTCTGELEVLDDGGGPWGVPWLDTPRRLAATVRLSRAGGLPRRLPDGLGLAVRVPDADGPGGTLDLLMTSSGRGRAGRHLPLPRADALRGPYSSLLPYRVAGRSCLLAAFPRRTRQAPVPGDPEEMAAALAAGPLVYDLCAERGDRTWRRFAVLTVRDVLPVDREDTLDFDPYGHSVRAFAPGPALAAIRRAAYRGSRVGRGTRREIP
ncbi:phosphodiesterase [Streptomyces sp. NPDC059720]|uniref:phosphodiesterase n=1 Tax=Streptomyces sp. NPDC059720 TaxID=3346924 RepID=UPI00369A820B